MMGLTIAYITSRKNPRFKWFWKSLHDQMQDGDDIDVVVVDHWKNARGEDKDIPPLLARCHTNEFWFSPRPPGVFTHVEPKPSIWCGPHRLTLENWFAASNARNTALCHAKHDWVAYVDDLSVLGPEWLVRVRHAMTQDAITLGAYRKVIDLSYAGRIGYDRNVLNFKPYYYGTDSRWNQGSDAGAVPADGGWLFGCSLVGPTEWFLDVNGWPEDLCDGMGSEDSCMGVAIQNAGRKFLYDRRMFTYEDHSLHTEDAPFRKEDWHFQNGTLIKGGNGKDDCSHAALNIARSSKWFPHYLGDGFDSMRTLRSHILSGGDFPIRKHPEHHWYTKTLIRELP